MADIRITDLVDPQAIDDLRTVQTEMNNAKTVYLEVVRAMAQSIKIKVETTGDLERMNSQIAAEAKKAEAATVQLNSAIQQQQATMAQTTPAISRNLDLIQQENKAKREAYTIDQAAVKTAEKYLGTLDQNTKKMAELKGRESDLKEAKKELNDAFQRGSITIENYNSRTADQIRQENELKIQKQELQRVITMQTKLSQAEEGSYKQLSLRLEEMKAAYKTLSPEEKQSSDEAKKMAEEISKLDAELKDAAADMGEFQRNTGNYAIAANKYVDVLFRAVGLNGNFGRSLSNLAKSGTGNFLADLTVKLKAFGASLMALLSNPYVLAVLGIAGTAMAFKWWYDYNKGLMTATRLTREFLDVHGVRLKEIRSEIQAIADEYDKDYKEVLQAVDTLTQQWKMDSETALRVIRDGFQAGADENGRFLGMLQQYAPIFKDMKAEASEMVAVLAQTRSGIFNEQGLAMMQMALKNVRDMTDGTKKSLAAIGVDVDAWIQKLNKGEADYLDFIVEISKKLSETNDQSQAFGAVLGDLFGRKGTAGGAELVKYLGQMTTEIEKVKAVTGEVGKLRDQHIEKQKELNKEVAKLFDVTEDGFEETTLQAKNYITEVLIRIVKWVGEIVDWFKEWYDQSVLLRAAINAIGFAFQTTWNLTKRYVELCYQAFKGLAETILTIFDFDTLFSSPEQWGKKVSDAFNGYLQGMKGSVVGFVNDTNEAFDAMYDRITNPPARKNKGSGGTSGSGQDEGVVIDIKTPADGTSNTVSGTTKQQAELRQIVLQATKDTIEKRLSMVKEGSDEELQLKKDLAEAEYQLSLFNATKAYNEGLKQLKEQKKSQEEYNEAVAVLTEQRTQTELAAEKAKLKAIEDAEKEYAKCAIERISERYAKEQEMADARLVMGQTRLKQEYIDGIKTKEQYESQSAELTAQYAVLAAQAVIQSLEEQLSVEQLTDEQRAELTRQLCAAKANLAKEAADAEIAEIERTAAADKKAAQQRMRNIQTWMRVASQAVGKVGALVSTLYDNEVKDIENEEEAAQQHYDQEVERITMLEETGAITKEESESRKAAASMRREQKEEELEKKKAELAYRQAVWEKATSVAQAGIATALAITQALPNIALAAVVGAMGAIEVATILSTPIQAYAKGTPKGGHKGGMALVGDGGRQEVISYNGLAWLTPDTPTLVELPKGAEVFPDAEEMQLRMLPTLIDGVASHNNEPRVIVNNDYRRLEKQMDKNNHLLRAMIISQREMAYKESFRNYIRTR